MAKGVLRLFLMTGSLLPKATATSPLGTVLNLPEPEMLRSLFPVDFLPLAWKVFVFDPVAKNRAPPDG